MQMKIGQVVGWEMPLLVEERLLAVVERLVVGQIMTVAVEEIVEAEVGIRLADLVKPVLFAFLVV